MSKSVAMVVALLAGVLCAPQAAQRGSTDIDALLRAAVDGRRVPIAVAVVADSKGVTYEHATGVGQDAIFAIASMTKPVTSVAVMQLVEAGKVALDEPAASYLPELAGIQVVEGGQRRAPKTRMTVRHLLSHTAGFGYEFLNAELLALVGKKEIPSVMGGGDGFMKAPLVFDPGSRWEYGINTDWLGKLVERVSGQSLEAYFREKIFAPLGMSDSFFNVPDDKRARVVPIFTRAADSGFGKQPPQAAKPIEFFSGGGGLFSTAGDYLTFARALLAGGELRGRRILSAKSVAAMGTNQLGKLEMRPPNSLIPQLSTPGAVLPGSLDQFGLGFALNKAPTSSGRGAGTLSWAGIFNTFFWIDREKQVAAVLMTQMLPFLDPGPQKLLEEFDRAVYAARGK